MSKWDFKMALLFFGSWGAFLIGMLAGVIKVKVVLP